MAKIDDSVKKKVPELRFPGFTDDWEVLKLGSLTTVVRGASPRPIQDPKWFDKESDIGWLRIADVTEQNGRIYHLEQGADVKIMDRFFRHRELPDSENFSKPGFHLKTA